ncbi:uncharacterized protein METZ01_LOCUS281936 [marine metagenome]|uniref:FAD-binding FR-type domain-containing protein n=1 Tax=marine metagenome TaxID=408172 RepID=A0A382L180_9ZZZZ
MPLSKLINRKDISDDLMVIRISKPESGFTYKPGQFCTLGLDGVERPYSIASGPYESELEIIIELVPNGALTPKLWRLRENDWMSIRPSAKGLFLLDEKVHHHFMLATVTGVAPFVSMIRQHLHDQAKGHFFYILLGASYSYELTYDTELARMHANYPDTIQFISTVSRPAEKINGEWTGQTGRVNEICQSYLAKFQLPPDNTRIYACGHPEMISDLKSKGLADSWLFTEERFWRS